MIKAPIDLQDLRTRIEEKAKADSSHRFWGMYVHVCKESTLLEAYRQAKRNNGAPGTDGITFAEIERQGVDVLIKQLAQELREGTYAPVPARAVRIPKPGKKGQFRTLKIPAIRDRVVQTALRLILEPAFEADFQDGSYGYRPNRGQHDALEKVRKALAHRLRVVVNCDLKLFFDNVRHDILLNKIAQRINDPRIMKLCKKILKSSGHIGIPQGSSIGPLFSNIFLNDVDKMLETAQRVTKDGKYETINYVRFADDLLVFVSDHKARTHWADKVEYRLRQEFGKLGVAINEAKSSRVDLNEKGSSIDYLGFRFRLFPDGKNPKKTVAICTPQRDRRTRFLREITEVLKRSLHIPVERVIKETLNSRIEGWVNYFAWGNSGDDFGFVSHHIDKKVRRFASRQQHLNRCGSRTWTSWSKEEIYEKWGLFSGYRVSWSRDARS